MDWRAQQHNPPWAWDVRVGAARGRALDRARRCYCRWWQRRDSRWNKKEADYRGQADAPAKSMGFPLEARGTFCSRSV